MYYIVWIILVAVSLWVSLAGFLWALKTGQFSDQGRARYLPLSGEFHLPEVKHPSKFGIEVYVLFGVIGIGTLAMAGALVLIFIHGGR